MAAVAIVTDADTCVPEALRRGLEILTAPVDAPLLIEPEPADVLRRDQAAAAASRSPRPARRSPASSRRPRSSRCQSPAR